MEAVSNAWHSLAIKPEKMRNHGGRPGENWGELNPKTRGKKEQSWGEKKTENRRNWSKIQRKNPENKGRQSTNFIYHRLHLSLSKHIETENQREHRRSIKYQKHENQPFAESQEQRRRRGRGEEARSTSQSFAIASSRPGKSFLFSHYFDQVAFTLCKCFNSLAQCSNTRALAHACCLAQPGHWPGRAGWVQPSPHMG